MIDGENADTKMASPSLAPAAHEWARVSLIVAKEPFQVTLRQHLEFIMRRLASAMKTPFRSTEPLVSKRLLLALSGH